MRGVGGGARTRPPMRANRGWMQRARPLPPMLALRAWMQMARPRPSCPMLALRAWMQMARLSQWSLLLVTAWAWLQRLCPPSTLTLALLAR